MRKGFYHFIAAFWLHCSLFEYATSDLIHKNTAFLRCWEERVSTYCRYCLLPACSLFVAISPIILAYASFCHLSLAPLGWPDWCFSKIFGSRKLESIDYHAPLFIWWYILAISIQCQLVMDSWTQENSTYVSLLVLWMTTCFRIVVLWCIMRIPNR